MVSRVTVEDGEMLQRTHHHNAQPVRKAGRGKSCYSGVNDGLVFATGFEMGVPLALQVTCHVSFC
jgi:hypothetical protein